MRFNSCIPILMKINKMKTLITLQKNWKSLAFNAIALLAGFQSMSQTSSPQESMRVSVYQLNSNGTTNLADGNLTNYDDAFSNGLSDDALKMTNFGENFGIYRLSTNLAIEQRKKILAADTTFFSMWNMQVRSYKLIITTYNLEHPGLLGFFEDNYLNTSTPLMLNSSNVFNFSIVNIPGSYASNRFRITFRNPTMSPLATTFTGFSGRLNNNKIELQWLVNNESAMREYVLEHSVDRINYSSISHLQPLNSSGIKTYNSIDAAYIKGDNFYRVKAVGLNGDVQYSTILKVNASATTQEILIYPNPVADKQITLVLPLQKPGKYLLNLYNSIGSSYPLTAIEVGSGENVQTVQLPKSLAPGVYRLRIISPDNVVTVKALNIL